MATQYFFFAFLIVSTVAFYVVYTWKSEMRSLEFKPILVLEGNGRSYFKIAARNTGDNEFYAFSRFHVVTFFIASSEIRSLAKREYDDINQAAEAITTLKGLLS